MGEIERARCRPPPAAACAATAVFWVLGDDDLLREILLRLVLPTSLLRVALVCKRWYRHASDPVLLRRFRERNPPRVLGVYLNDVRRPRPWFFPIRPLPELAAAVRRANSLFDAFVGYPVFVSCSRGNHLLVTTLTSFDEDYGYYDPVDQLCSPLSSAGNALVIPPPPPLPPIQHTGLELVNYCPSLPIAGDGRSYLSVLVRVSEQQTTVCLYELQDMCWVARASAAAQLPLPGWPPTPRLDTLFNDSKFYILVAGKKNSCVRFSILKYLSHGAAKWSVYHVLFCSLS